MFSEIKASDLYLSLILSVSSVAQSCLTICDPMDCRTPGFHVHHKLLELTQTHVHWVSDGIQPSQPLLFPLYLAFIFPSIRVFSNESALQSGGQSTGVSASTSVLPMNIQDWFPLGWTGWISLQSNGLSRVFAKTTVQKHQFFGVQLSLWSNSHIYTWILEKPEFWLDGPLLAKSLLFNMLSRLVIAFLSRGKCLLISWLQSPCAVILELPKIKYLTVFIFFPIYLPWSDGTGCHDLRFLNVEF